MCYYAVWLCRAWKDFHALMQWEREEEERKRNMAVVQHNHTVLQQLFGKWKVHHFL